MIRLVVSAEENGNTVTVTEITATTLLEALAVLHEDLNAVGMPRQYRSYSYTPAGPTTVSC